MNELKLPKYDPRSRCEKCGDDDAETQHFVSRYVVDEHLLRTCRRCGYRWAERCVDGVQNFGDCIECGNRIEAGDTFAENTKGERSHGACWVKELESGGSKNAP